MHIVIAVISLLIGGAYWYSRLNAAGRAAGDLRDAANDVRLAARRFGFKRRSNVHPIDALDDARLAAAGIVAATAQMDCMWEQSIWIAMLQQTQSVFNVDLQEAEEITTFARWIADQGGNPHEAVRRLSKRLKRLAGQDALEDTVTMIRAVSGRGGRVLSQDAKEAIETVERVLKTV